MSVQNLELPFERDPIRQEDLWLPAGVGNLAVKGSEDGRDLFVPSQNKELLMGKIVDYGTLSDVINSGSGEIIHHPVGEIWTGKISLAKREAANPGLRDRVSEVLNPLNIESYYVAANLSSRTRCIDGRLLDGWLASRELQFRDLGPQVPGGTPTMALAIRLVEDELLNSTVTLSQDIDDTVKNLMQKGLTFGGHIDEGHGDDMKTGCGAIDELRGIVKKSLEPVTAFQMKGLLRSMLGDKFDLEIYHSIVGEVRDLWAMEAIYLARNEDGQFEYNHHAIDALRNNATEENPVAKLTGPHNEVGLVINTVKGTTFNRDSFSSDNDNEIQLFNYDIWHSHQLSETLYPGDERRQVKFITARAMFAVSTAMQLTDGSVRLLVRS